MNKRRSRVAHRRRCNLALLAEIAVACAATAYPDLGDLFLALTCGIGAFVIVDTITQLTDRK